MGEGATTAPEDAERLAALIEAVAERRDRDAFRALYAALAPSVKTLALRQGADAGAAEELTQETFLTIWRKAALYSPARGGVRSWVFAIARNLRIDRLRRAFPWQELTDDLAERPSEDAPADELLASRQIQIRVRAVMAILPPEQAKVIDLAYVDGLTQSEIAARLGIPLGTVKTRMSLAYGKLRAALQDLA